MHLGSRFYWTLGIPHLILLRSVVSILALVPYKFNLFLLAHQPGANMRIARQRLDGAWDFEDPEDPFEPDGVADLSPKPTNASPKRSTIKTTLAQAKAKWDHRRDAGGSSAGVLEPPPPAYHAKDHVDEGYTNMKD
jgi:hypothetical protein